MIIVSACLVGVNCRYNGKDFSNKKALELFRQGRALPICPEMLGGLLAPRMPAEIVAGKILSSDGSDLTDDYLRGARIAADIVHVAGCRSAILKAKSPTCGYGKIYDGTFSGKVIDGDGVFAAMLREQNVAVYSDENIPDDLP